MSKEDAWKALLDRACDELASSDCVLGTLMRRIGRCGWRPSIVDEAFDPFKGLCQCIVHQQLADNVAYTIYLRFKGLFPDGRPTPAELLELGEEPLRAIGLSGRKISYLRGLARAFLDGSVRITVDMDDERVVEEVTALRGLGRWSADMFLIFELGRTDVLPSSDLGIRKAVRLLDGLPSTPDPAYVDRRGGSWRPWRTVAAWYLWRSLRGADGPGRNAAADYGGEGEKKVPLRRRGGRGKRGGSRGSRTISRLHFGGFPA